MSLPPTSFRLPFALPTDQDTHPLVAMAIRYAFTGLKDVNDAIKALNTKVTSAATTTTTTGGAAGGSSPSQNVGGVNNQSGNTTYQLQNTDFGALVIINTASPFALDLNSGISPPFYAVIENLGTGVVTCTAATGTVNNAASFPLISGQSGLVFYDGVNFWITTLPQYLLGGSTGTGRVVLDSGATLIKPTVDSGTLVSCTSTGVTSIQGLPIYANNAAAVGGGLVAGNLYRTNANPDFVAVVH